MDVADNAHGGRFLIVQVNDRCRAGLPLQSVIEVTPALPVEPLAGAPSFVKGVAVVRAAPLPVLDLAALLGLDGAPKTSRFILIRTPSQTVALTADSVIGITHIAEELLGRVPPLLQNAPGELVEAVGALDGDLLLILSLARLMPDNILDPLPANGGAG